MGLSDAPESHPLLVDCYITSPPPPRPAQGPPPATACCMRRSDVRRFSLDQQAPRLACISMRAQLMAGWARSGAASSLSCSRHQTRRFCTQSLARQRLSSPASTPWPLILKLTRCIDTPAPWHSSSSRERLSVSQRDGGTMQQPWTHASPSWVISTMLKRMQGAWCARC